MKIFLRILAVFFIIMIIGVIGGYLYISKEFKYDIDKLLVYNPNLTTKIYDRNGELIANLLIKKTEFMLHMMRYLRMLSKLF